MAIILVFDEDLDYGLLLKRLLEGSGHSVVTLSNRNEALEWTVSNDPDLVIVNSPRAFGGATDLAHLLIENNTDLRVMIVSNHTVFHARKSEFLDVLLQPLSLGTIEGRVESLLGMREALKYK